MMSWSVREKEEGVSVRQKETACCLRCAAAFALYENMRQALHLAGSGEGNRLIPGPLGAGGDATWARVRGGARWAS